MRPTIRHRERLDRWARPVPRPVQGDGLGAMLVKVVALCVGIAIAIVVFGGPPR